MIPISSLFTTYLHEDRIKRSVIVLPCRRCQLSNDEEGANNTRHHQTGGNGV